MKYEHSVARKIPTSKLIVLFVALAVVVSGIVGGTIAWLVANTDPVVNTFTYGDINITLEETDTNKDGDNNPNTNNYPMIPGKTITKDPVITFKADSEDAWLFVKLDKSANFDDFMTYEIADGWIALDNNDGVYYRSVDKTATDITFEVIKNNAVSVKSEVTKEMLNALDANNATDYPQLTVTAYAVQRDADIEALKTAASAWTLVNSANP